MDCGARARRALPPTLVACLAWLGASQGALAAQSAGTPTEEPRGVIRGHVEVRAPTADPTGRPDVAALGMPMAHAMPDRSRCVVYLEVAPQGAFEPTEHPPATLDQRDTAFVPYVLAIPVGTTVNFPNHDRIYHNVFSLSKTRRFDLGRYPRGQSRSVRFDRPGVVRVFCEIHSHMSAYILVFAHRFFSTTDAQGHFEIPTVPPGHYSLAVWRDGKVRARRPIVVPDSEDALDADFVVD